MAAFGAPYSVMLLEIDNVGMYDTAAENLGKVFVSTELGGGGSATAATAAIAKRGVTNFLKHAGILTGEPECGPSTELEMPDQRCFVSCETAGLIEYCDELGAAVEQGQLIARVHDVERTGRIPVEYRAKISGLFIGRHFPGLARLGDFLAAVAVPVEPR